MSDQMCSSAVGRYADDVAGAHVQELNQPKAAGDAAARRTIGVKNAEGSLERRSKNRDLISRISI